MKQLVLLFILFSFGFRSAAQNKSVESAKVAFISQKINITPSQAEKFWPLYNELGNKKTEIRQSVRDLYTKMTQSSEQTTEKTKVHLQQIAALKHEDVNLEKEYYGRYLLVITPKQLADLIAAEREFQKILLKKLSESE